MYIQTQPWQHLVRNILSVPRCLYCEKEISTYTCVNFAIIIRHQHIYNVVKLVMIGIHKHLVLLFASQKPHIQVSVIEYTCRQRQSSPEQLILLRNTGSNCCWSSSLQHTWFVAATIDHIRATSPIICDGLHLSIVPRLDITFSITLCYQTLAHCNYHPF